MSDDLIARLREWKDDSLCYEAADAIESLDSALEAAQHLAMQRGDELNAKDAEIERLTAERDAMRDALDKIAERTGSDDPCASYVQIARSALMVAAAIRKRPIPGSPYETRISKTLLYTKGTT